jgi:hypothetical protein
MNQRINAGIKKLQHDLIQFINGPPVVYWIKIIGIILLTTGIFILCFPVDVNDTIVLSYIFIAIFILFFIPGENIQLTNDVYIFFFLTAWLIIMFFILNDGAIETFFFSVVLGMFIAKEFANGFITPQFKKRLSIVTLVFFSISMILVAEKVISVFNI